MKLHLGFIAQGFLAATLSTLPQSFASGPTCLPKEPAVASVNETLNKMYYPDNLKGCCAMGMHEGLGDWRNNVENQVAKVLKADKNREVISKGMEAEKIEFQNSIDFLLSGDFQKHGISLDLENNAKHSISESDYWKKLLDKNNSISQNRGDANMVRNAVAAFSRPPLSRVPDQQLEKARISWVKEKEASFEQKIQSAGDQSFRERVVAAAKAKSCANGVDFKFEPEKGMRTERLSKKVTHEQALKNLAFKTAELESTNKVGSAVYACSEPVMKNGKLEPAPVHKTIDLKSENADFANNQNTLADDQLKIIKDSIKKAMAEVPGCQKKLKSVQVETSASLLANTDVRWGRFKFDALSESRANYLKEQVQGFIGNTNMPIKVNSNGTNGDGTSGRCPYALKEKAGPAGQTLIYRNEAVTNDELTNNRFGHINLEIDETGPGCADAPQKDDISDPIYVASKCFEMQITCK